MFPLSKTFYCRDFESIETSLICSECSNLLINPIFNSKKKINICNNCRNENDLNIYFNIEESEIQNIYQKLKNQFVTCILCTFQCTFHDFINDHIHSKHDGIIMPSKDPLKNPLKETNELQKEINNAIIITETKSDLPVNIITDDFVDDFDIINLEDDENAEEINNLMALTEQKSLVVANSDPYFEFELLIKHKLDLCPFMILNFSNNEDIPILKKQPPSFSYINSRNNNESFNYHQKKRHQFIGKLAFYNIDESKPSSSSQKVMDLYIIVDENDNPIEKKMFSFPQDFEHQPFYTYSFYAEDSDQIQYIDQIEVEIWNAIINTQYPLKIMSSDWSKKSWLALMETLYQSPPLKYRSNQMIEDTFLPDSVFDETTKKMKLSSIYITKVRPNFSVKSRSMFEVLKNFRFFFFSQEIEELKKTWIPSHESLIAINIDGLYIIYNIFSDQGDLEIKKKFIKYLFFRPPNEEVELHYDHNRKISIHDLFKCQSQCYTWQFPTFSVNQRSSIIQYVFKKNPRGYTNDLKNEIDIMSIIESHFSQTDTCIYQSSMLDYFRALQKSNPKLNINDVIENLSNLQMIKRFERLPDSGKNSNNQDYCIVKYENFKRAEMLLHALQTLFKNWIELKNNESLSSSSNSIINKFEWSIHPDADMNYISNVPSSFRLSGEQEKTLYYFQNLPLININGEAGTGKTEIMRKICSTYSKHEIIYLSAVASTVFDVGFKKVCKRSMTLSRFLIIHNNYCLNVENETILKLNFMKLTSMEKKKKILQQSVQSVPLPPSSSSSFIPVDKYECKPLNLKFNKCPCEKLKLIIIDEISIIDIALICRLFYMLSRCAHKNVKIVLGGDGGQIPSISAGDTHHDINRILAPFTINYQIDHRLSSKMDQFSIQRLSNAKAIRDGLFENLAFDTISTFLPNRNTYETNNPNIQIGKVCYHFVEISNVITYKQDADTILSNMMPTLNYLLNEKAYLGRINDYGESNHLHICCPTNVYKNAIGNFIAKNIFLKNAKNNSRNNINMHEIISVFGQREDVFKGMKITYKRNRYEEGIELYNNLIYVVYRIQDVAFEESSRSRKKKNDDPMDDLYEKYTNYDENQDDIIGGEDGQNNSSSSSSSSEKKTSEIRKEFEKYSFEKTEIIQNHHDLPSTAAFHPNHLKKGSYGRRLLVVPANDVQEDGTLSTKQNIKIIPWTSNHTHLIQRSSCTTIFGSQGREFKIVIIFCPHFWKLSDINQSLYVAVTRSTEIVVIVSTKTLIKNIIENKLEQRKTHFHHFIYPHLKSFYDHPSLKINTLPDYITSRLLEDEEKLHSIKQRIQEFRNQIKHENDDSNQVNTIIGLEFDKPSDPNIQKMFANNPLLSIKDVEKTKSFSLSSIAASFRSNRNRFNNEASSSKRNEHPIDDDIDQHQSISKKPLSSSSISLDF